MKALGAKAEWWRCLTLLRHNLLDKHCNLEISIIRQYQLLMKHRFWDLGLDFMTCLARFVFYQQSRDHEEVDGEVGLVRMSRFLWGNDSKWFQAQIYWNKMDHSSSKSVWRTVWQTYFGDSSHLESWHMKSHRASAEKWRWEQNFTTFTKSCWRGGGGCSKSAYFAHVFYGWAHTHSHTYIQITLKISLLA